MNGKGFLQKNKKLSKLKSLIEKYPQKLDSFYVKEKKPLEEIKGFLDVMKWAEKKLGEDGRFLVRYSGTSKKCRVLVEGKDEVLIKEVSKKIVDTIRKEVGE